MGIFEGAPVGPGAETVKGWLREHNHAAVPELWAVFDRRGGEPVLIFLEARDAAGNLTGGLIGSSAFAWLRVDIMAVAPTLRRQGIGAALLERAEAEGSARGCRYAYIDTMSHQASGF